MNNSLEKNGYHDYSSSSSGNGFYSNEDSMLMRNKYNNNMDSRNSLSEKSRNLDYFLNNSGGKETSGNNAGGYEDDFPVLSSVSGKFSGLRLDSVPSSPSKNNFCF